MKRWREGCKRDPCHLRSWSGARIFAAYSSGRDVLPKTGRYEQWELEHRPSPMNFTTLEAAHLAAHQLRLEGQHAEVLDECAGSLFGQLYPSGFRVVAEPTGDDDDLMSQESSAVPAEEHECGPIGLGAWEFLVVCVLTAMMLTVVYYLPVVLHAALHGAPALLIAWTLICTVLVGALIGLALSPLLAVGFWLISLHKQGHPAVRILFVTAALLMLGALLTIKLGF